MSFVTGSIIFFVAGYVLGSGVRYLIEIAY